jgi:hypothetical protein
MTVCARPFWHECGTAVTVTPQSAPEFPHGSFSAVQSRKALATAHPEVRTAISLVVDDDQVQGMSQYRLAPGIPLSQAAMA